MGLKKSKAEAVTTVMDVMEGVQRVVKCAAGKRRR